MGLSRAQLALRHKEAEDNLKLDMMKFASKSFFINFFIIKWASREFSTNKARRGSFFNQDFWNEYSSKSDFGYPLGRHNSFFGRKGKINHPVRVGMFFWAHSSIKRRIWSKDLLKIMWPDNVCKLGQNQDIVDN